MKFSSYNMFLKDLYKDGLEYAASHAAKLGFSGVELLDFCPLRSKPTYSLYSIDEYKAAFEKYSLELACYSSAALLYTDDEQAVLEEIYRQAEFASALGSKYFHHTFTIGLSSKPDTLAFSAVLERVAPMAEKVASKCRELGMTAIYEPQGAYFNGKNGFMALFNEMKGRGAEIGVCGDVGNTMFFDEGAEKLFAECAADIKHVHVKDYIVSDVPLPEYPGNMKSISGMHLYDCEVGMGAIDLRSCFELLCKVGYDGYFSIELLEDDEGAERMMKYMESLLHSNK